MKIGLLYSYGPQFINAGKFLCEHYPEEEVLVFVPQNFPNDLFELFNINRIKIIHLPWNGLHEPLCKAMKTSYFILKEIRKYKLDLLVVLFESPRILTLSKLSRSKKIYIYDIYQNFYPTQHNLYSIWIRTIINRIKGLLTYLYLWLYIHIIH